MKKLLLVLMLCSNLVYALDANVEWTGTNQGEGLGLLYSYYAMDEGNKMSGRLETYSPKLISSGTGDWYDHFFTRLTVPEDLKLVTSDGYSVGDELCVGDKFRFARGLLKGEYWNDGGDLDTPPIYWVDDTENFSLNLIEYHIKKIESGQDPYQYMPERYLFSLDDGNNMLFDSSFQKTLIDHLRSIGYPDLADELEGADFTINNPQDINPATGFPTYPSIVFTKGGKKIASILIKDINENYSYVPYPEGFLVMESGASIIIANPHFSTDIHPGNLPFYAYYSFPDGFVDQLTGIPVYKTEITGLSNLAGSHNVTSHGAMVCSTQEGSQEMIGAVADSGYYRTGDKGNITYNNIFNITCTYYFFGTVDFSDKYYIIQMPAILPILYFNPFKIGEIQFTKNINIVSPAKPNVEVSVAGADSIKFDGLNTLRVYVKNTGDVDVSIKNVHSTPEGKLDSCDAQSRAPGQQAECLLSVTPVQGQGLSVQVSYDYKSCGRSQTGLVTKTLIDSKTVRPVLKEQSYLMGVHGACDNSYYSCYSASEGSLFAGYKCFKTANGFYAPATERFNMRFDLSELPKDWQIIGATLHLKASEVGKGQTIQIYPVDKIPEAVKCLPGGDICTKPYCGECKPIYDLSGSRYSSSDVPQTGSYSFNVSDIVKEKVTSDGIVSLQVRGTEGLWETQGESSCSIENDWDKRDVSFDAGGRDGPYLEVVYK